MECHVDGENGEPEVTLSKDHGKYQWFTPEEVTVLEPCATAINDVAKQYLDIKRA